MAELRMCYGVPGIDARQSSGHASVAEFDLDELSDDLRLEPAEPDFTIWRDRSLYLIAPRSAIVEELRRRAQCKITVGDGTLDIRVRRGSSTLANATRTFWGGVKGAARTAATPISMMAMVQKNTSGVLNHIANVPLGIAHMATHNPWANAGATMNSELAKQKAKSVDAIIEVSCAASNYHGGAFAAAARPAAGQPERSLNSTISFGQLAERVRRAL